MELEPQKKKSWFFIAEKNLNGTIMIFAYDSRKRLIPLSEKKNLADAMLAINGKYPDTLFINTARSTRDIRSVFFTSSSLDFDSNICFITNRSIL